MTPISKCVLGTAHVMLEESNAAVAPRSGGNTAILYKFADQDELRVVCPHTHPEPLETECLHACVRKRQGGKIRQKREMKEDVHNTAQRA